MLACPDQIRHHAASRPTGQSQLSIPQPAGQSSNARIQRCLVFASALNLSLVGAAFAAPLYVSPGGNDANACTSTGAACLTISAAITKALAGDTIIVAAGTYPEGLLIDKSVTVTGAGAGASIIAPTTLPDPIVAIDGAGTFVDFSGFTVRYAAGSYPNVGSIYGVHVRNGAQANIHDNTITEIHNPTIESNFGRAIVVGFTGGGTGPGTAAPTTIANNTISHFQKSGIIVGGSTWAADVTGNTVTDGALGDTRPNPPTLLAPNGITVTDGALGTISGNTVAGMQCDYAAGGCGSDPLTDVMATGINLTGPANGTIVCGNNVSTSDIGILVAGLPSGPTSPVELCDNTVSNNRYVGIYGSNAELTLTGNTITNNPTGVVAAAYASDARGTTINIGAGNTASGNGEDVAALAEPGATPPVVTGALDPGVAGAASIPTLSATLTALLAALLLATGALTLRRRALCRAT